MGPRRAFLGLTFVSPGSDPAERKTRAPNLGLWDLGAKGSDLDSPEARVALNTVPYHTIPRRTIPRRTVLYCTVLHHTLPYHTTPYRTTPHRTTLPYHAVPYRTRTSNSMRHCMTGQWRRFHSLSSPPCASLLILRGEIRGWSLLILRGGAESEEIRGVDT